MIIAHLLHDLDTLKACSLTCRSWYVATVSHLHHTLSFKQDINDTARDKLRPLSALHELRLAPLIKEIQVDQSLGQYAWFVPRAFNRRDLRYFSTFSNVHTLRLRNLDIPRFLPDISRYFGHFSPTLQSITLYRPRCAPQQLSHFLSLFPNLDDIELRSPFIIDTGPGKLAPFSSPPPGLRGRLALCDFHQVEVLTHLVASFGGLRFRHINLRNAVTSAPVLLKACARTLETLRFSVADDIYSKLFCAGLQIQADGE